MRQHYRAETTDSCLPDSQLCNYRIWCIARRKKRTINNSTPAMLVSRNPDYCLSGFKSRSTYILACISGQPGDHTHRWDILFGEKS